MRSPFVVRTGRVSLRVGAMERMALGSVPALLDSGGDAGGRLAYVTHPDDPEADERFADLVGDDLDQMRRADRVAYERLVGGAEVALEDLEAFMRVVGEARLVLAARLGIEDDGWESAAHPDDPEMALLGWLGWVQDSAVGVLTSLLP